MKQIYTPDLVIRLKHGGVLNLSVFREDKVELLRAVVRSLDLNRSGAQLAQKLIFEVERAPKFGGMWGNVKHLVKAPNCKVCNKETRFQGKRKYSLCEEHNNWRVYLKIRRQKQS